MSERSDSLKESLIDSSSNLEITVDSYGSSPEPTKPIDISSTTENDPGSESKATIFSSENPSAYVTMCVMIASLNSANLGYDQGVTTGLVHTFQRDNDNGLRFSNIQIELFVAMLSFAAMVGAAAMFYFSDKYGRRFIFFTSQLILILGLLIMIAAPNYGVIMFGRFITGFGVGLSIAVGPMFIAEISPPPIRGRLVSWTETAINIGILLGFVSSWVFSGANGNTQWRAMLSLGLIMPVLLLVLVTWWMPESPRWLLQQGRTEEAALVLQKCAGDEANPKRGDELASTLQADIDEERELTAAVTWPNMYQDDSTRRRLLAGVGVAAGQQISGEEALLYYMIIILQDAGIDNSDEVYSSLICVGLAKVAAIIMAGYLFDSFGRRILLQASNAGMAGALFLLAIASYVAPIAAFVALVLYVVAFSSGMGPGAWLIPSEVFSNDIRAKGLSMCTVSNRAVSLVVLSTFLSLKSVLSPAGIFSLYGCFAVGMIFFVRFYVPETKGRNLESMHELFGISKS